MKRFLMLLTIALTCLSLFAASAEAKRFGGGSSFGKQRSMAPQQAQRSPAAAPAPGAASAKPGNKWLGPLAGLAIGAGLATLFAGGLGGMGGAMGSILMALLAAGVVMFLIAKFRKPQQSAMQYAGAGAPYSAPRAEPQPFVGGSSTRVRPRWWLAWRRDLRMPWRSWHSRKSTAKNCAPPTCRSA